jgi:UDP-GlcNAc:undecaprenyl-phosphate/decaprenyl-phosphate GlcNAc-1-phosphate transferase
LVLTPLCGWVGVRLGVLDLPSGRKIHRRPIPLLGGVGVLLAFVASAVMFLSPSSRDQVLLLIAGAAAFSVIGLIDDFVDAGAWKLGAEAVVVIGVVWFGGVDPHLPWPYAGEILAVLWILGVANAVNCFDCADGIAAGTVAVTALLVIPLSFFWGRIGVAVTAAALAGATLGFLRYNFSPARIFLGDAGSLMVGFLVAALPAALIPSREYHAPLVTWIAPLLLMCVPVGDFLFVHVRRYLKGVRDPIRLMTSTGKDHLPHRLLEGGLSARQAALWLYAATALTGASGVTLVIFGPPAALVFLGALLTTGAGRRMVSWAWVKSA